jgi:hypothetical protein
MSTERPRCADCEALPERFRQGGWTNVEYGASAEPSVMWSHSPGWTETTKTAACPKCGWGRLVSVEVHRSVPYRITLDSEVQDALNRLGAALTQAEHYAFELSRLLKTKTVSIPTNSAMPLGTFLFGEVSGSYALVTHYREGGSPEHLGAKAPDKAE